MSLVEREESELTLSTQASLLVVARSSLYYQKTEPSEWEIELKRRIDLIYTDYPFYGSRRITYQLGQSGFSVNRRTVQRYMREMGLEAIAPGPNLSKRNHEHKVYPYLLRVWKPAIPTTSGESILPIYRFERAGPTWLLSWTGIAASL